MGEYGFTYEDELPDDISKEEYDQWYEKSHLSDIRWGVRVGPSFPLRVENSCPISKSGYYLFLWKPNWADRPIIELAHFHASSGTARFFSDEPDADVGAISRCLIEFQEIPLPIEMQSDGTWRFSQGKRMREDKEK